MLLFIHKRKSEHPTGTVTTPDGLVIGQAMRTSRVAAGFKGQRRTFYTAKVVWTDAPLGERGYYAYIGTRYVTRSQAVAAIRDFYRYSTQYGSPSTRTEFYNEATLWIEDRRDAHPFNDYPQEVAR